jgi:hypothetical protein
MPYRLYKQKTSDNWWIDIKVKGRGRIRRSAGTADRKKADALAKRLEAREWNRLIEGDSASLTFAEAVTIYVDDGGSDLYLDKLVDHFKDRRVADIAPGDIKAAAKKLYPDCVPATWNRQVIVPARAVINHCAEKSDVAGKRLAHHIRVEKFAELKPVRNAGWRLASGLLGARHTADCRPGALYARYGRANYASYQCRMGEGRPTGGDRHYPYIEKAS